MCTDRANQIGPKMGVTPAIVGTGALRTVPKRVTRSEVGRDGLEHVTLLHLSDEAETIAGSQTRMFHGDNACRGA